MLTKLREMSSRLDSRLYLWGNKKPMGEREAYWSLMVLPWLFIGGMLGIMIMGICLVFTTRPGNFSVGAGVFVAVLAVGWTVWVLWGLAARARDGGYRSVIYKHYLQNREERVAKVKEVLGRE